VSNFVTLFFSVSLGQAVGFCPNNKQTTTQQGQKDLDWASEFKQTNKQITQLPQITHFTFSSQFVYIGDNLP
jgi:hypothetical protein